MRVLWLDTARADLREIVTYLLDRNPAAARRMAAAIRDQVEMLADQPGLGRPGRVADTRELVVTNTPYLVAYTVDRTADAIIILRVLHGARRWPDDL